MADIACSFCGVSRPIVTLASKGGVYAPWVYDDQIRGSVICGSCSHESVFHMRGDTLTYLPGQIIMKPDSDIGDDARESFEEATRAFYGRCYRATVAFCRSSVEDSLDYKKVLGDNLFNKAHAAHGKNLPLDDEAFALATGARLIGRNALHRKMNVTMSQALAMLTGTLDLLNHIGKQPAMQSGLSN